MYHLKIIWQIILGSMEEEIQWQVEARLEIWQISLVIDVILTL